MGGEKRVNRSVRRISASRRTIQVTKHRGKRPVGADLERLVRAYRSGKTLAEVGCEFGLSPTGVLKILRQLGEPTRRPGKKTYSDGLTGYQRWRKRMQATPEGREHLRNRAHRRQLRREYGLTCEGYSALSAAQNGACAVCGAVPPFGRKTRLLVDHCHATGRVRGLLCNRCNVVIGMANDSPELLGALAEYLRRHVTEAA